MLTPDTIRYAANSWPGDISDARRRLGWEPTPFRVVAARLGAAAAAAGNKLYVGFGAGGKK